MATASASERGEAKGDDPVPELAGGFGVRDVGREPGEHDGSRRLFEMAEPVDAPNAVGTIGSYRAVSRRAAQLVGDVGAADVLADRGAGIAPCQQDSVDCVQQEQREISRAD